MKNEVVTETQKQIIHLLSLGLSADEIASRVHLSKAAVNANTQRLRKKLECPNNNALVAKAIWQKII